MAKDSKTRTTEEAASRPAGVSRRNLLAAAGAGALAVNMPAAFAGPSGAAWKDGADVIVVGSGAAAHTAAVCAAKRGCSVLMLEKAAGIGGTTAKSGGGWWAPNNHLMRRDGIADPREDAIKYLARCSYPALYNPDSAHYGLREEEYSLLAAYYDNASAATEELAGMGALQADYYVEGGKKYLDYYAQFEEDKAPVGRCLKPAGFGKTTLAGGAEMIRQLSTRAAALGVRVLLGHRVRGLVMDDSGEISGVEAEHDGRVLRFAAGRAVIFGSGGFTHNVEMAHDYLRGPIFGGCAVPTNTGDFVNIASRAGAALGNMNNAWWSQIVLEQALVSRSVPNDAFNLGGDSSLLVNRYGRRAVNEKSRYNERTQSHFIWDPVAGEYPNMLQYFIYDSRTASGSYAFNSYPIPPAGTDMPYLISGKTLAELAGNLAARLAGLSDRLPVEARLDSGFPQQLEETVRRFNGFAESGRDEDFHRGEHPIDMINVHSGNGKPNPVMYPLSDTGPYYGIILAAGTLDTKGGPRVNARAQVLDTGGAVIPRLYGAGNCIASPAAQAYWGGGSTIGCAITFGYLAGKHAAAEQRKKV